MSEASSDKRLSLNETWRIVRRLFSYLGRRKFSWLVAAVAMVAAAFTSLSALAFIPILIRALGDGTATLQSTLLTILEMAGLTLLGALLLWFGRVRIAALAQALLADIRSDYFDALMRQSLSFYRAREVGELITVGMNDGDIIGSYFTVEVPYALFSLFRVIVALIYMFAYSPILALGTLVVVLIVQGIIAFLILPTIQRLTTIYQRETSTVSAKFDEALTNVRDIQIFTQESRLSREFRARLDQLAGRVVGNMNYVAVSTAAAYALTILGPAMAIGVGTLLVLQGRLGAEFIVGFSTYVTQFVGQILTLNETAVRTQGLFIAARRLFGVMDIPTEIADKPEAIDPGPLRGHIKFENVTFSYAPDDPGSWRVKNINLEILPGEKVAFVGGSGTGKSTLVYLVARFYEVTEGRVTVDGYDVRDLKLAALRRNFGMVAQNAGLFAGTVADNIRFGRPEADQQAVYAAAAVGNVVEFVGKLEAGYDTALGEMGQGLSGGQKQRVSIARAALLKPSILILDEATSALDTLSETAVMHALDRLSEGRTSLVIAHRLNTIANADKIVVLGTDEHGHGIVKAIGRHEELLETSDEYYSLYRAKAQKKSILMPIGPMYNTVPLLPTVIGLARTYDAPVNVLDFGTLTVAETQGKRYGLTIQFSKSDAQADVVELNRAHLQRVQGVMDVLRSEGVPCRVVYPPADTDWVAATLKVIEMTNATHYVAMENVLVPLAELREAIRKIERKTDVDYILVDPMVGVSQEEAQYQMVEDVRGADPSAMATIRHKLTRDTILQAQAAAKLAAATPPPPKPEAAAPIAQFNPPIILLMFVWPAVLYLLCALWLYPLLRDALSLPAYPAFLLAALPGSMAELIAGLRLAKGEGKSLIKRLGLGWPATRREWQIAVGVAVGLLLVNLALFPLTRQIFDSPADWAGLFTAPLWLSWVVVQVIPFVTVIGRELYYRGYILPKMKGTFGDYDWLANAGLSALAQVYQPWAAFTPGNILNTLAFAYYGKRRQVWVSILLHYLSFWLAVLVVNR
jgi:ABC-type multidrug transport system fused ATPase/permease subunit